MVDLGIWEQVEQRISKIKNCQMDAFIYLALTSFCFCLSLSPRFLLLYFDFNKTCFSVPLSFDYSPGFNICIFLPCLALPVLCNPNSCQGSLTGVVNQLILGECFPSFLSNALRIDTCYNIKISFQVFMPLCFNQPLNIQFASLAVHSLDYITHNNMIVLIRGLFILFAES